MTVVVHLPRRRRRPQLLAVVLGLLLIALGTPAATLACTADVGEVDDRERAYDVAFVGRVVRTTDFDDSVSFETEFDVDRVLSGPIRTGPLIVEVDGCHPIGFAPGQRVVVTSAIERSHRDEAAWEFGGYTTWAWRIDEDGRGEPLFWWFDDVDSPDYPPGYVSEAEILAFVERGIAAYLPTTSTASGGDGLVKLLGGLVTIVAGCGVALAGERRRRARRPA